MDRRIYDNYVYMIAREGSLTKAAAALGISQPALSSGLNSLEKDVGIKIFDRKCTPIAFTPEGRVYYEYIKRMRVLTEDFQRRVDGMRHDADNAAVIGAPVAYAESVIPEAVMRLLAKDPDCRVSVKSSPLSELIDLARRGEINCFISTSDDIPANFEKKHIKKENVYLCIPRKNPVNAAFAGCETIPGGEGPLIDFSQLDGEKFIFLEEGQPLQQQAMRFLAEHNVTPKCSITVNQVSAALNFAIRGEGICFASESALQSSMRPDTVCIYSLPGTVSGRSIYIAYDRELFMPRACRELIGLLTGEMEEDEG